MTTADQRRAWVLAKLVGGELSVPVVAVFLGLSERSVWRLRARFTREGPAALVHGNRGRASSRRVGEAVRARVVELARTTYAGANDTHLPELLAEHEGIERSRVTVRRILRAGGIGLRRFVDDRYRLVASDSFKRALRSAVRALRRTNLPVGITVAHGSHAWILTGFSATADPAVTRHFTVTSVRVVGPLWGLQSRSYGYDMRGDKRLTNAQLKGFFTPWHYGPIRMSWEGDWVSVQPRGA